MIGALRGTVISVGEGEAIVDVGGLGYRVTVSGVTAATLRGRSGEVQLWTHTLLRQDSLSLVGFESLEERDLFEILLTTPGVGPSLALAILGTLGPRGVVGAVAADEPAAFEAVPGVGKKTAARLVLELGGRLAAFDGSFDTGDRAGTSAGAEETGDVAAALGQLGYSTDEVRRAVSVLDGTEPVETALRLALRELSRR